MSAPAKPLFLFDTRKNAARSRRKVLRAFEMLSRFGCRTGHVNPLATGCEKRHAHAHNEAAEELERIFHKFFVEAELEALNLAQRHDVIDDMIAKSKDRKTKRRCRIFDRIYLPRIAAIESLFVRPEEGKEGRVQRCLFHEKEASDSDREADEEI